MVFFLVTAFLSGVVILLGASLARWIFRKVAPDTVASRHVVTTVGLVSVTTAAYVYIMTRPSIVGPYEQWTFENIGGQVLGGVLAAGVMMWTGRTAES